MENANVTGLLSRKERIMKQESELRKQLEVNFSSLQSEKSTLQDEIAKIKSRLTTVEEALVIETNKREKADVEYAALRSQVNQASERSRLDLQALRQGIQTLKKGRKEDAKTMQNMAAEVDRLKLAYIADQENATDIASQIDRIKEKHKEQIERALKVIRKQVEDQMGENQVHEDQTGQVLAELKAINGKIRAVDPDLR
jgi:chromosome segregation ATPase